MLNENTTRLTLVPAGERECHEFQIHIKSIEKDSGVNSGGLPFESGLVLGSDCLIAKV